MDDKPDPELTEGQRVRVILNERNRTPHVGTIRQVVWHFKDTRCYYLIEENGKKISKWYYIEDLELI